MNLKQRFNRLAVLFCLHVKKFFLLKNVQSEIKSLAFVAVQIAESYVHANGLEKYDIAVNYLFSNIKLPWYLKSNFAKNYLKKELKNFIKNNIENALMVLKKRLLEDA